MAVKTWGSGQTITTADLNAYSANPMLRTLYVTNNMRDSFETTYDATFGFRWYGTGLFTSEFSNYRIVLPEISTIGGGPSPTYFWYLRFTVAGVANTTANYNHAVLRSDTAATLAQNNAVSQTEGLICEANGNGGVSNNASSWAIDIYSPQLAAPTMYAGRGGNLRQATSRYEVFACAGGFNANTQFDGICLYARAPGGGLPNSGSLSTGPLLVYGYLQS